MSLTIHDRFIDEANTIKCMLADRVEAAMAYVNAKLGFNAWSRDLDDNQQVIAFILPVEIYDNEHLRGHLWKFINNVFYAHILSVEESHLMPDSSLESIFEVMGEDSCERYEVDWHGSRSRKVELGPHLYFRLGFDGWIGRPCSDPEPPNMEIAWEVVAETPDCYTYIQKAKMINHTDSP
jgi:hypothetical protein